MPHEHIRRTYGQSTLASTLAGALTSGRMLIKHVEEEGAAMMPWPKRFWIGGGGALLPLLVTLLAVDLASIIDNYHLYSMGTYVGTGMRYAILFALGGIVAALNIDEINPIRLVQIGIAAPALIASYVNAQPAKAGADQPRPPTTQGRLDSLSLISSAHAGETVQRPDRPMLFAGFFEDAFRAIRVPLPQIEPKKSPPVLIPATTLQSEIEARVMREMEARVRQETEREMAQRAARVEEIRRAIQDASTSSAVATTAAKKAAEEAAILDFGVSPEAVATVKQSAEDALVAARRAESDITTLEAASRIGGAL
jgi:hypothetical protein